MKKSGLLLGILLVSLCQLSAQVTVKVTLDQNEFLPGESLPVAVRITNRSGETLHLGKDPGWLTFAIESKDSYVVAETGKVPVVEKFTLPTAMLAIKHVDLAPYFNLVRPGRYSIIATVTVKAWNRQFTSDAKSFNVINGVNLWEQEIGVPRPGGGSNGPPELRKYALLQANYLHRLTLYFRLTDNTAHIHRVYPIGPMLSFGQPEPQVDGWNNLHVLYQNGPHSFSYTVFDPNGDLIERRTYDYTTRPRIVAASDGRLKVVGGRRRIMPDDLPPPSLETTNSQAANP